MPKEHPKLVRNAYTTLLKACPSCTLYHILNKFKTCTLHIQDLFDMKPNAWVVASSLFLLYSLIFHYNMRLI